MGRFQGKLAVVTGGSSGIGLAAAQLLVEEGAHVFIVGRRQAELDQAVESLGASASGVRADVSELADLDRLYEAVAAKGRIDVLFANAGISEPSPLGSITEVQYDRVLGINFKGTLFTVQKALPLLNDGAAIVLTGSIASVKGTPGFGLYEASKAAVRSLVRSWSVELKDRRIRSNVVSPGPASTPILDGLPPDVIAQIVATIPMGRMGRPEEIARAVLFLASDDASYITGIELFVDGGAAQV